MIMKFATAGIMLAWLQVAPSCSNTQTADQTQTQNQETMQTQAVQQIGLPNIVNFREMRTLKMVEELADQAVPTYSYLYNNMQGCLVYIGPTFGFPIPYATEYTNPSKVVDINGNSVATNGGSQVESVIPQADPNGLFKPSEAAGTWILMMNPATKELQPQYIEADVETFTFRMTNECK
jgi:hypothetical protein